ncbi:MAG: hypothetical protein IJN00_04395, partial [Clostridia bacterium]|nr:hypothetical protein [Clostridia bacterium]
PYSAFFGLLGYGPKSMVQNCSFQKMRRCSFLSRIHIYCTPVSGVIARKTGTFQKKKRSPLRCR